MFYDVNHKYPLAVRLNTTIVYTRKNTKWKQGFEFVLSGKWRGSSYLFAKTIH